MKSGGVDLLSVEVLQMFLKDLIGSLVCFTKVLQDLKKAILVINSYGDGHSVFDRGLLGTGGCNIWLWGYRSFSEKS